MGVAIVCALQSYQATCSQLNQKYSKFDLIFTRQSNIRTTPTAIKYSLITSFKNKFSKYANFNPLHAKLEGELHAVCTAQVFRNRQSGLYLYLFSRYYLSLGYMVIVYDRYVVVMWPCFDL